MTQSESTKANLAKLATLIDKGRTDLAEQPAAPKETPWDSDAFKKEVIGYTKYIALSAAESIGHCQRFWTWYSGLEPPPKNLDAMVCGILSSATIDEKRLLHKDMIGTTDNVPEKAADGKVVGIKFYSVSSMMNVSKTYSLANGGTISAEHCVNWLNKILDGLRETTLATTEGLSQKKTNLINLTALVLLNCCRLATKDPQAVQDHISASIVNRAASLFSIMMSDYATNPIFSPPCHDFVVTFSERLKKGGSVSKTILSRIIYSHVFAEDESERIRSVYRTGCMLSLSYTGLSPVAWLVKAAKTLKMTQLDLLKKVYITQMESFVTKYLSLADYKDSTWIYCRLVSETALLRFSASMEPFATAVFVALCYDPRNPDQTMWTIPSLSCISYDDVVRAHCVAEAVIQGKPNLKDEVGLTDEAGKTASTLKDIADASYIKYMGKFRNLFTEGRALAKTADAEPDDPESDEESDEGGQGNPAGADQQPKSGKDGSSINKRFDLN